MRRRQIICNCAIKKIKFVPEKAVVEKLTDLTPVSCGNGASASAAAFPKFETNLTDRGGCAAEEQSSAVETPKPALNQEVKKEVAPKLPRVQAGKRPAEGPGTATPLTIWMELNKEPPLLQVVPRRPKILTLDEAIATDDLSKATHPPSSPESLRTYNRHLFLCGKKNAQDPVKIWINRYTGKR